MNLGYWYAKEFSTQNNASNQPHSREKARSINKSQETPVGKEAASVSARGRKQQPTATVTRAMGTHPSKIIIDICLIIWETGIQSIIQTHSITTS
jgi:hypothetical protein